MYSRNYGRGESSAKITPPPAYSGSAIQGKETGGTLEKEEPRLATGAFAPFSQSIPQPKSTAEEACAHEETVREEEKEAAQTAAHEAAKKEKSSFLSSFLPDLSTEDLILIGIVAALAFNLADRDILLVALVIAVVVM